MNILGLASFLFRKTGGMYEMSHINVLAYFQDDCLTWSIYTYVDIYVYIDGMKSVDFMVLDQALEVLFSTLDPPQITALVEKICNSSVLTCFYKILIAISVLLPLS